MARRPKTTTPVKAELTPAEMSRGLRRFKGLLKQLEDFDPDSMKGEDDPRIFELSAAAESAVHKTFEADTSEFKRFQLLRSFRRQVPMYGGRSTPVHEVRQSLLVAKERALVLVRQAIDELEDDLVDHDITGDTEATELAQREQAAFVVHGHDEGAREAVARFLERLDIKAIILHEQTNQGQTIIEKFERHKDVSFAVVLLTPDDVGGLPGEDPRPRARQNVILELGYFIGALGRSKVCVLKKGDIEIPSDILGIVYEPFDEGGAWQMKLAREIKSAGIEVDLNKVWD